MFEEYWRALQEVFREDPKMLTHTERVLNHAETIAESMGLTGNLRRIVQLAALLHDVGIVEAFKKHGSREGRYQHIEGPPIARRIMEEQREDQEVIERVVFLVGHHHDFSSVDGLDFQILIEADMLVNLAEENMPHDTLASFIESFFQTPKGRELARHIYLPA